VAPRCGVLALVLLLGDEGFLYFGIDYWRSTMSEIMQSPLCNGCEVPKLPTI
jgi:hypothetical protein